METRADLLMRQASMTAHDYMQKAISDIDNLLGEGYAKEHPELIAAYMQTAALDFMASFGLADHLENINFLEPRHCRYVLPQ